MGMLMPEISAATVSEWLKDYSEDISEHANELTDLDRQIGDADHGSNMARGMTAVAALDPNSFASAAELLKKAGMTLVSTVGGASGPLYGTFFLRLASPLLSCLPMPSMPAWPASWLAVRLRSATRPWLMRCPPPLMPSRRSPPTVVLPPRPLQRRRKPPMRAAMRPSIWWLVEAGPPILENAVGDTRTQEPPQWPCSWGPPHAACQELNHE